MQCSSTLTEKGTMTMQELTLHCLQCWPHISVLSCPCLANPNSNHLSQCSLSNLPKMTCRTKWTILLDPLVGDMHEPTKSLYLTESPLISTLSKTPKIQQSL